MPLLFGLIRNGDAEVKYLAAKLCSTCGELNLERTFDSTLATGPTRSIQYPTRGRRAFISLVCGPLWVACVDVSTSHIHHYV